MYHSGQTKAQEIASNLSSCQNNLARNKNQQHNLWLLHPIDQAREELWFVLESESQAKYQDTGRTIQEGS